IRQFAAGQASEAMKAADFARFALRRLARSRPSADPAGALAVLDQAGPALQQALLGPAARQLGDGPVIIVPTGKLLPIPWAILPALKDRVTNVAPSAAAWMRAHRATEPKHRDVVLHRAPYRLVLSSCEGAVLAPAGANELLGLVSSLLPLGTAGIIAGLVPLNDQALVPLMVDLHRHLRAGQTLAESLYRVRHARKDDPVQHATATSLVALGAA